MNQTGINTVKFAEFFHAGGSVCYCKESSTSPVSRLLFHSRPPAVSRLVVAVVVDAIKRKSGRFLAHVSQEVLKRRPAFANRNPSAPVIPERFSEGICASLNHRGPTGIGARGSFVPIVLNARMAVSCKRDCNFPPVGHSFGRHNVASINVVFNGGRPATTGAHCDCRMFPLTVKDSWP